MLNIPYPAQRRHTKTQEFHQHSSISQWQRVHFIGLAHIRRVTVDSAKRFLKALEERGSEKCTMGEQLIPTRPEPLKVRS